MPRASWGIACGKFCQRKIARALSSQRRPISPVTTTLRKASTHASKNGRSARFAGDGEHHPAAGTGKVVTDLIFSIAKREVTFLSGTVAISLL